MERYRNRSGDSGVVAYAVRDDAIEVRFANGGEYLYTVESAGKRHIAEMIRRARAGRGLSTWISQQNPAYARRH